jgi:hypothetical protein
MKLALLNNTTKRIIMPKYKIPGGPRWDAAPGSRRDAEQDLPALFAMAVMLALALRLSRWPHKAVRALLRHAIAEPFDDPAVMQTTFLLPPESSGGARRPAVTLGRLLGLALDHEGIDPADPLDGRSPATERPRWHDAIADVWLELGDRLRLDADGLHRILELPGKLKAPGREPPRHTRLEGSLAAGLLEIARDLPQAAPVGQGPPDHPDGLEYGAVTRAAYASRARRARPK